LYFRRPIKSPSLSFKFSLPTELKGAEPLYRGRLWLDAETKQIRREERELTLRHPSFADPLILFRYEFDYAASRFGILTPQRIVVSTYNKGGMGADKLPKLLLGGKVTFAYGGFRRFDAGSPNASLDPPAKP
jgi:hypothetical protein